MLDPRSYSTKNVPICIHALEFNEKFKNNMEMGKYFGKAYKSILDYTFKNGNF